MFSNEKKKGDSHTNTFHIHYKKELSLLQDSFMQLSIRLEKVEAKEQASAELRSIQRHSVDHLQEQIGEIKELFQVLEDDKKNLVISIEQTNRIVKSANPMELLKTVRSYDTKIEQNKSKFDLIDKKFSRFETDFKKFSQKLKVFKGEDELLKLQDRTKDDLRNVEKVSMTVNSHASKLENHFIKINEKVSEATNFMVDMKDLQKTMVGLQSSVEGKLSSFDDLQNTFATEKAHFLEEISDESIQSELDEIVEITTSSITDIKKVQSDALVKLTALTEKLKDYGEFQKWVKYLAHKEHTEKYPNE